MVKLLQINLKGVLLIKAVYLANQSVFQIVGNVLRIIIYREGKVLKKNILFFTILFVSNTYARNVDISDYAYSCALKATYSDFRGDLGKVAESCKLCLIDMPMNIDKTDQNLLNGVQACLTKYQEIRAPKK